MKLKYLIFDNNFAMLFADPITHRSAAKSYHQKVTGAGFCSIEFNANKLNVSVWGESFSLGGMESKPEDADVIASLFY